jgi:hypothetical protein
VEGCRHHAVIENAVDAHLRGHLAKDADIRAVRSQDVAGMDHGHVRRSTGCGKVVDALQERQALGSVRVSFDEEVLHINVDQCGAGGRYDVVHHAPPSGGPLSPRQAAWLLLRPSADLTPREQAARARLEEHPVIQAAQAVVGAFRRVVREQDEAALAPWLAQAQASGSVELREFGAGIGRDQAAVAAALRLPYSSGPVEGQVTRVKLVKRAGYGRATFEVLRKRILLAR